MKISAPLYYAIRLINITLSLIFVAFLFITYLWLHNFNLHFDDKFLKASLFKQKIHFEGAEFLEKRSPSKEWLVRIYNANELNYDILQEEPYNLSPNVKGQNAVFVPGYNTLELTVGEMVVHKLFNRIYCCSVANMILIFVFFFLLRRILISARQGHAYCRTVISSFRWMAVILVIFCFMPYSVTGMLISYIHENFAYGYHRSLLNWHGINTNILLIASSLVLLCLAENSRQAAKLKEEQELTI